MRLPLTAFRLLSFSAFCALLLGVDSGAASRAQAGACFGATATIVGTEGPDNIQGTSGADVIASLGGRDVIDGAGGDDRICSGDEIDHVRGGAGSDMVDGGEGLDQLYGDGADDILDGGAGDDFDVFTGGAGNDTLIGKRPGDFLSDKADFDSATGPIRVDLVAGVATGEGNDRLVGIDWVDGSAFDDVLIGNDGDNLIDGSGGNDRIEGGPGGDLLSGGAGDDSIAGGAGEGSGILRDDLLNYRAARAAVTVDLGARRAAGEGTDAISGIEGAFGSDFADRLVGDAGNNKFWGLGGNDELRGQSGEDRALFDNAVDANLTQGRAVGDGTDRLIGIEGLQGSDGNDRLVGDGGANFLAGGFGGNDVLTGAAGADVLLAGGPSRLSGGAGADLVIGGPRDDRLEGGSDKDAFFGGAGHDVLRGGSGDDLLAGEAGDDSVDGGGGAGDTVNYAFAFQGVTVSLSRGLASGVGTDRLSSIESVFGSFGEDEIVGDARANSLSGGGGDDRITGGAGADFLDGGDGNDELEAGAGSDYCLESGRACEIAGTPAIPGAAPRPPGVPPPDQRRLLRTRPALEAQLRALLRDVPARMPEQYVLALSAARLVAPTRVQRGEIAAYKYAAEPVCFAQKPYRTEIAPPRTVGPVAGDGKPEEAWWQGTLYRASGRGYKKFKTTPWARAALAGGSAVPGVTLWKDQTGKRPFPNFVSVKTKAGRYVWKGNIYWVRSGGQVFEPIEPHIIRARTIGHDKQCVFR